MEGKIVQNIGQKRIRMELHVLFTILIIFTFLLLFVLFPLLKVAFFSIVDENGKISLKVLQEVLMKKYYINALINSFKLALVVATISTIIGYLLAFSLTKVDIPFKNFFRNLAIIPIISPPFVLALAMIFLFGRQGLITRQLLGIKDFSVYGFKSLVVVQALTGIPIAFLTISAMLENMDPAVEDAAMCLGAEKSTIFRTVILPLSASGITSAFILVMVESLTDFANPVILGGDFSVLSVLIYTEVTSFFNLRTASVLSLTLLIPSILLFVLQRYYISKKSYITISGKPSYQKELIRDKGMILAFFSFCVLFALVVFVLYGVVIFGSFTKVWGVDLTFTFKHYKDALIMGFESLRNSLELSLISALIGSFLGLVIAYLTIRKHFFGKKFMEALSLLTFAVPGTVIGVGYVLAFNQPPISLTGTALILIIALLFRNIPVAVESGISILYQIDPNIEEASTALGANSFATFRSVTLPLLKSALFSGMVYEFVRAMTAVSSIIFLVSARWQLVTVSIMAQVEQADFGTASAQVTIMLIIILIAISLMGFSIGRLGRGEYGI